MTEGMALDCRPPTIEFAEHWNNLDLDGDGVWSLAEAEKLEEQYPNVKSKLLLTNWLALLKE